MIALVGSINGSPVWTGANLSWSSWPVAFPSRNGERKRDSREGCEATALRVASLRQRWRRQRVAALSRHFFSPYSSFPEISESPPWKIPLLPRIGELSCRALCKSGACIKACRNLLFARALPWLSAELYQACTSCLYEWHKSTRSASRNRVYNVSRRIQPRPAITSELCFLLAVSGEWNRMIKRMR